MVAEKEDGHRRVALDQRGHAARVGVKESTTEAAQIRPVARTRWKVWSQVTGFIGSRRYSQ
jgi:hypothetical protein